MNPKYRLVTKSGLPITELIGAYQLAFDVDSKIIKIPAGTLSQIIPDNHQTIIMNLTDWLVLLEQFQKQLHSLKSTLFDDCKKWNTKLIRLGGEIRGSILNNILQSKNPILVESFLIMLEDLLAQERDLELTNDGDNEFIHDISILLNFWINEIKASGWYLARDLKVMII